MTFLQAAEGIGGFPALLILLVVGLIVHLIIKYTKSIDEVSGHDLQPFENMQFSSQEFYGLVEALIKEKQINGVWMGRVYHSMHGVFSGKREYLRVRYMNYFFDICAAPIAKDFFVSFRHGTLNVLIKQKRQKTFYEMDTESMFHAAVKLCYKRAIEQMEIAKGRRAPSGNFAQLQ